MTIYHHWFRQWLATNWWQAITWTNDDKNFVTILGSLDFNKCVYHADVNIICHNKNVMKMKHKHCGLWNKQIFYHYYHYVLKCKNEKCIWKIFVKYTQIRQSNTNTNISYCGFSNTNTNTDICVFKHKYKYVFDPSPDTDVCTVVKNYLVVHLNQSIFMSFGYCYATSETQNKIKLEWGLHEQFATPVGPPFCLHVWWRACLSSSGLDRFCLRTTIQSRRLYCVNLGAAPMLVTLAISGSL